MSQLICLIGLYMYKTEINWSWFFIILDDWNKQQYNFTKSDFGKWELHIPPNPDGSCPIKHESKIKVGYYCYYFFFKKQYKYKLYKPL